MENKFRNMSMTDIAYGLVKSKRRGIAFEKLWKEVSETMGLTVEEVEAKISHFYTSISLDGRFITTGENRWDLRERNKYDDVHIDMKDIYQDVEELSDEDDIDFANLDDEDGLDDDYGDIDEDDPYLEFNDEDVDY